MSDRVRVPRATPTRTTTKDEDEDEDEDEERRLRTLFVTGGGASGARPETPLAGAMRAGGHEIRSVGPPAGARSATPLPARGGPATTGASLSRTLRKHTAAELVDEAVAVARSWQPDLVVAGDFTLAGGVAAAASGAASARLVVGPDPLGPRGELLDDPAVSAWLRPLLAVYGLDTAGVAGALHGHWRIDTAPPGAPVPDDPWRVPMRAVAPVEPGPVPDWLDKDPVRPRVALALDRAPEGLVHDAVDALDVEAIRVDETVPVWSLVPTCSAVVHHDNPEVAAAALASGVPQLVVRPGDGCPPGGAAEHGAARRCDLAGLTAGVLAHELHRVLTEPHHRTHADHLRRQVGRAPTPLDVVPVLERLTAWWHGPARGRVQPAGRRVPRAATRTPDVLLKVTG